VGERKEQDYERGKHGSTGVRWEGEVSVWGERGVEGDGLGAR